MKTGATRFQ
jgi:hypothetical protein